MNDKFKTGLSVTMTLFALICSNASAQDNSSINKHSNSITQHKRSLDESKSRVFVYRTDAALGWVGVDFVVQGRRYSRLSKEEFDVVELPTGENNIEIVQGGASLEVCRLKLTIDPLKDNFLKIRNRDGGLARHFFSTGSLLGQALDKSACGGVNEMIKVSQEEAEKELPKMKFSPLKSPVDPMMTKENICKFVTSGKEDDCSVSQASIVSFSPVVYAQSQRKPELVKTSVAGESSPSSNLGAENVKCQVESNPIIEVDAKACLTIKGTIVDASSYSCAIAANPPIKLAPDLCIQGGGRLVRQ